MASPENGEICGWLPKIFFNRPRHRKTTRLAVVCSLRHALNCLGLESHRRTHNPYHRRDMLSTSIKSPIAAGNSETTTTPQYHRSEGGEIKDVDPGTTDEVHPTDYAARQSIPETIRKQEDMSTSKKGRCLFSAWNTSSDVPPRDPSAAARSSFFTAHPHRQAPPTITPKTGSGDGCRLGVRNSGNTGPPETRAGHVLPSQ